MGSPPAGPSYVGHHSHTWKGHEMHEVPEALRGLELYEDDPVLCAKWQGFFAAARRAYPQVDIEAEVAKAHAWEVTQPGSRRKKARDRFLMNWIKRSAESARPAISQPPLFRAERTEQQRKVSRDEIRERFRRARGGELGGAGDPGGSADERGGGST